MMKTILLLVLMTLAAGAATASGNAVTCEISSLYYDSTASQAVPLSVDTTTLYLGISRTGFPVAFALQAEVTAIDTHQVDLTVQITTTGATPQTKSKRFSVEYGLPAEIRGITAKTGQDYRLRIVPLEATDATPEPCTFDHTKRGVFKIFPTANMDLRYVPGSLAEFHQTLIRDVMETRFKQFRLAFSLSLPGKYDLFACPCALPSVLWDDRFAMAQDPTRSLMFAIHATDFTSIDPFIICHTALLRHFGYTPPVLSEGLAGYFGVAIHDMRELIDNGAHRPLAEIMPTSKYMAADAMLADRTAATVARYLIDTYGYDRFRELYELAHDGNLLEQVSNLYGVSLEELQSQWLTWVDTVTILPEQAHLAAEQAEVLRQYGRMAECFELMLSLADDTRDSSMALAGIVRAAYYDGDYYQAVDLQEQRVESDSAASDKRASLAGYQMMAGEYDSAMETIDAILNVDPDNAFATFNSALYNLTAGDTSAAVEVLKDMVASAEAAPSPEAVVLLHSVSEPDGLSPTLVAGARADLHRRISVNPMEASAYLWLAWSNLIEARQGTGSGTALQTAEELLQVVHLIESRTFYLGMLFLLEGKLADLRQDRETAREWYGRVLSNASAAYHQEEATALLETPYGASQ